MAVITGNRVDGDNFVATITWAAVTTGDTAQLADVSDLVERTIHIVGAGNAQLRGSNNGVNFVNMGTALAANSLTQMDIMPKYIDFNPIAANTVTIILVGKRL